MSDLIPASDVEATSAVLFEELRSLIESARERTARFVNRELVVLYWEIGRRLRSDMAGDYEAIFWAGMRGRSTVRRLSRQCRDN
jgi:hypothetical protein